MAAGDKSQHMEFDSKEPTLSCFASLHDNNNAGMLISRWNAVDNLDFITIHDISAPITDNLEMDEMMKFRPI